MHCYCARYCMRNANSVLALDSSHIRELARWVCWIPLRRSLIGGLPLDNSSEKNPMGEAQAAGEGECDASTIREPTSERTQAEGARSRTTSAGCLKPQRSRRRSRRDAPLRKYRMAGTSGGSALLLGRDTRDAAGKNLRHEQLSALPIKGHAGRGDEHGIDDYGRRVGRIETQ
jgi:hypothetical protein